MSKHLMQLAQRHVVENITTIRLSGPLQCDGKNGLSHVQLWGSLNCKVKPNESYAAMPSNSTINYVAQAKRAIGTKSGKTADIDSNTLLNFTRCQRKPPSMRCDYGILDTPNPYTKARCTMYTATCLQTCSEALAGPAQLSAHTHPPTKDWTTAIASADTTLYDDGPGCTGGRDAYPEYEVK
jgi:hypothetical protein